MNTSKVPVTKRFEVVIVYKDGTQATLSHKDRFDWAKRATAERHMADYIEWHGSNPNFDRAYVSAFYRG